MATLLKVLINLADIKSAGGVALRVGIQGRGNLLIKPAYDHRLYRTRSVTLPVVADFADWRRKAPADGSARYGEHMDQRSAEPVRLVIWDLDETFWKGTLTDGGITFAPENRDVVIALAERGIISTICSKNDLEPVRDILKQHDVWDYFVFPSVTGSRKGPGCRR